MTHSNDSRRPRRARRPLTAAALVLLASIGWAQQVSAVDPILSLAIDPDTPTTVYAGTYCRGVFKSLDGGDSWSAVNTGLPDDASILALAINPSWPTYLYAGTGGGGVFRSYNGGSTWSAVNTGLPDDASILALAINPTSPATLYAAGSGVFRSLDRGSSWSAVNTGLPDMPFMWVRALAINPAMPTTLYAGTVDHGVFRSLNGGSSWQATGLTDQQIRALALDPTTPTTLYAGTEGGGAFRSLDAGSSWSAVNTSLPDMWVGALAINPTSPATLYAGTVGVFRSLNGGGNWQATSLTDRYVKALAIDPTTPATLYAGTDAGVFRSLNGGDSWQATGHLGCGDGLVRCYEQCDDGGESATCNADCTVARCGDGILNVTAGEHCDDGNRNPFDGCTNDCTVCGDGEFTPPEECDDGNTSSGDGCDAQCRLPRVVGTGTPQNCTEAEFAAALAERSVRFDCGPDPVTITLTNEKAITADTIIDGGGLITLSGGGAVTIFRVDARASLDVQNLTIADGHTEFSEGGAIYNGGTVTLTNCTLRGNSASGNSENSWGGAIYNTGTLTLTNCTLSGNSADSFGGAIYNHYYGSTLTLTNCTLSANSARAGGGIFNAGEATATLTNCTLSGNSASAAPDYSSGGGIHNMTGTPGLYPIGPGKLTLRNTIVANSPSGGDCSGERITDSGHNLIEDATNSCGLTNGVNGNIVGVDPLLGPLANNGGPTQTIALLPGSPAINAGDPDVCVNPPVSGVDQRGFARPGSGHTQCSIGAYEADAFSPEPCVGDCDGTGSVTIDEIITLVNIALGNAQASACPHGVPNGAEVNVALIIRAVNAALNGCGGG